MGLNSGRLREVNGVVDTANSTTINGIIAGNGTNVIAATAIQGDALPVTGGTLGAQLSAIDSVLYGLEEALDFIVGGEVG